MLKQIQVQLYPQEEPHWHGDIKKHWHSSGVFIVSFEKIPQLFLEIKVKASKSYETFKHRYKLCHINQMAQIARWKEETWKVEQEKWKTSQSLSVKVLLGFVLTYTL